jgi:hypothetical protein
MVAAIELLWGTSYLSISSNVIQMLITSVMLVPLVHAQSGNADVTGGLVLLNK